MTPAVTLLERLGTPHRVLTYDHDPSADSYGEEAATALGLEPDTVFKTLMVDLDRSRLVVAVVPVSSRLDLKAVAVAGGAKKAGMADPADAERATGYVLGGISPVGQRKRLPTFVDASAERHDLIHVSGGRRGLEIEIAPADLLATVDGHYADITLTAD